MGDQTFAWAAKKCRWRDEGNAPYTIEQLPPEDHTVARAACGRARVRGRGTLAFPGTVPGAASRDQRRAQGALGRRWAGGAQGGGGGGIRFFFSSTPLLWEQGRAPIHGVYGAENVPPLLCLVFATPHFDVLFLLFGSATQAGSRNAALQAPLEKKKTKGCNIAGAAEAEVRTKAMP
eukprot:gene25838-biopygen6030